MNFIQKLIWIAIGLLAFIAGVLLNAIFFNSWIEILLIGLGLAAAAALWILVIDGQKNASGKSSSKSHYDKYATSPDDAEESAIEVLDDTQASLMFNQAADGFMELLHSNFQTHSAYFYLYNAVEDEWILQSFRSECLGFSKKNVFKGEEALLFQSMKSEPLVIALKGTPFYYTQLLQLRSAALFPLYRRGQLLGVVGVDHTKDNYFNDKTVDRIRILTRMIVQSVQSMDGVYIKNKLRRYLQWTREFSAALTRKRGEEAIVAQLRQALSGALSFDTMQIFLKSAEGHLQMAAIAGDGRESEILSRDVLEKTMFHQKRSFVTGEGEFRSTLIVPICDQGHCFGAAVLASKETNAWDIYEAQFAETLAHATGLALARTHLVRHLTEHETHDSQTGMDNEPAFMKRLDAEVERAKRFGTTFCLLVFYVDYVKNIYETFGVVAGDRILEKIAEIIQSGIRQIDRAGRLQDDRFGILLVESKQTSAMECARRLLTKIENTEIDFGGELAPLTATIGIAVYGSDGDTARTLMLSTEQALVRAKKLKEQQISFVN